MYQFFFYFLISHRLYIYNEINIHGIHETINEYVHNIYIYFVCCSYIRLPCLFSRTDKSLCSLKIIAYLRCRIAKRIVQKNIFKKCVPRVRHLAHEVRCKYIIITKSFILNHLKAIDGSKHSHT